MFKDLFPDSPIARGYGSARTKTTCIINGSLSPYFQNNLVESMKSAPFALAIDGSNDNGLEKMNPLTVRIFDLESKKVITNLLDMCLTSGELLLFIIIHTHTHIYTVGTDCGTASNIFAKMEETLQKHHISWEHCIGMSTDNTSVNLGIRNSIMTRVKEKNPAVYFMGCPCHIVHNCALKATEKFAQVYLI